MGALSIQMSNNLRDSPRSVVINFKRSATADDVPPKVECLKVCTIAFFYEDHQSYKRYSCSQLNVCIYIFILRLEGVCARDRHAKPAGGANDSLKHPTHGTSLVSVVRTNVRACVCCMVFSCVKLLRDGLNKWQCRV